MARSRPHYAKRRTLLHKHILGLRTAYWMDIFVIASPDAKTCSGTVLSSGTVGSYRRRIAEWYESCTNTRIRPILLPKRVRSN